VEALLFVLVLAAHLLCMNVASAGPLLCIGLDARAARGDRGAESAARWLSATSVWLAVVGAVLGLVQGWLRWDAEYASVLRQFSARVHWGAAEFVFSLLLMVAYAVWLARVPRGSSLVRWLRSLLVLLAATNLLYHFPTLFALIAQASTGRIDPGPVDSATFRRLIMQGDVLALTTHFALASLAVSGVALIGFSLGRRVSESEGQSIGIFGGRVALAATVVQLPVGLWLLMNVPPRSQQLLMGGDLIGSILLGASILATLGLLHPLAAIAFGDFNRRNGVRAMLFLAMVVLAMCGVLQRLHP
jgi:hypothetical protein